MVVEGVADFLTVMGNVLNRYGRSSLLILLCLVVPAVTGSAKPKHKHPPAVPPQDQIQVIAHLPLTGSVHHFSMTRHYSRDYLYAEYDSGKTVSLIDTTNPDHPAVLADVTYPAHANADTLLAVTGNAVLVADGPAPSPAFHPGRTIRIMSFADPAHPAVQQAFQNVAAMAQDDRRGLIFLANADGLWILRQQFAPDPAVEAQWEHDVLGNR